MSARVDRRESIVLSWSGGKDSALALAALRADQGIEVRALLTSVTRGYDRISIHGVRRSLLHAQAQAVGLPLIEIELEPRSSNDAYETAFRAGMVAVRTTYPEVRRIAFGDLFLEDVRAYREGLVGTTGFGTSYPLWGRPTSELARHFVDAGFVAHLVCVDTQQMDAALSGRQFDHALLAELPAGVDPCGERGEFHTFVSDGPIFARSIPVRLGDTVLHDNRFAYRDLLPADVDGV